PRLFAPPELELLSFNTLRERSEAFSGRDSFWLEGAIRAVKEVRGGSAEEARQWVEELEAEDLTTQRFYRLLQESIAGRTLVDKTPSYALDLEILRRAEAAFAEPLYVHLIRHPNGMIHSFEEAKLDQLFFRYPHPYARRELAELIWTVSHQNIVRFLGEVPAGRQHRVHFEELVRDPERVLRSLCDLLGLGFHPDMAAPYKDKTARMTDGLHAASRMLGDVKFHRYSGVEAGVAERWREELSERDLGEVTLAVAGELGVELAPEEQWIPIEPRVWTGGEPVPLSFAQERLWFLDQLDPGRSAYNIATAVRLAGRLDVAVLARCQVEIVRRHAAVRTTFQIAGDRPMQVIAAAAPISLPDVDLAGLPSGPRAAEARRLAQEEADRPFDLARG